MITSTRNYHWRDLLKADRAITSLNIMNEVKAHKSTKAHKQQSANGSLSTNKKSESKSSHFIAPVPVVLNRYRHFKLSSDSIKSRTIKINKSCNKNQHEDREIEMIEKEVLNTERNERDSKVKQLRERINQFTGRKRSRHQSSHDKGDNMSTSSHRKLVNSKFIIKSKSNILTKFDLSRDRQFLSSLTESRIEKKKPEETKEEMEATRKGWARIMKCLEF